MRLSGVAILIGLWSVAGVSAWAEAPPCKDKCEAERKKVQQALEECLAEVEPRPPDRAVKMRLLCRQKYQPPRCENAPPCAPKKTVPPPKPGLRLEPLVFSTTKRGAAVASPRYAPGTEVFVAVGVELVSKPNATRVWLKLDLRMLAVEKQGQTREVVRWDAYAEKQEFLDPAERGQPKRYTFHGGAKLPPDLAAGTYQMEATVKEIGSGFDQSGRGEFVVAGGKATR